MRVLVITNMYPPHSYGGYEESCRDVVRIWRSRGHQVTVLTSTVCIPGAAAGSPCGPGLPEGTHQTADSPVLRTLRLYWDDHRILNPTARERLSIEWHNERALDEALHQAKPDIVSAWAMGAMSLGILTRLHSARVPTVLVICDEWPVYGTSTDAWLRVMANRRQIARLAHASSRLAVDLPPLDQLGAACFVSDHLRETVRSRSPWSFPRSTVIHSGIPLYAFPFSSRRNRPWTWSLAYVGRIDPRKGIDTAVRCLSMCPPTAELTVCGTGDEAHLQDIDILAKDLGLSGRIRFISVPRTRMAEIYAKADAVLFPPLWDEPFGLVPLEAMACGTPVVAVPSGGAAEFLSHGVNCLTVPPDDALEMAQSLRHLAEDVTLRDRLVEGGRSTSASFSVDRYAAALESVHLRVLAGETAS